MADFTLVFYETVSYDANAPCQGGTESLMFWDYESTPRDEIAPSVLAFDPIGLSDLGDADPFSFVVIDEDETGEGFAAIVVAIEFDDGRYEVVHDGADFASNYVEGSSITPIDGGYEYEIARDDGWTYGPFTVRVLAVDKGGNATSETASYDANVAAEPPGDVTAPEIADLSPAAGSTLSPTTAVSFTVEDASAFASVVVMVRFPSGVYEVVHDGTSFAAAYERYSTRVVKGGGNEYSVRRFGGWREAPTFKVVAVDASGNAS